MNNQRKLSGIIVVFVRDKIERVRKNGVVDAESLGGRGDVLVFHLWDRRRHSFHCLEVGLAHLVKVSLGLFGAALHLAGLGLGAMALAEALGLDDAVAALYPAVPAFVFQKHGVFGKEMRRIIDVGIRSLVLLFHRCNESTGLVVIRHQIDHRIVFGSSSRRVGVSGDMRRGHGPVPFSLE